VSLEGSGTQDCTRPDRQQVSLLWSRTSSCPGWVGHSLAWEKLWVAPSVKSPALWAAASSPHPSVPSPIPTLPPLPGMNSRFLLEQVSQYSFPTIPECSSSSSRWSVWVIQQRKHSYPSTHIHRFWFGTCGLVAPHTGGLGQLCAHRRPEGCGRCGVWKTWLP
jgi:hypothetical protein